jgi:hypothetical protein
VGLTVAAVIAVIGIATLYFMNFGPKNDVQRGRINMVTQAAVDRAGATALPTEPAAQPTRPFAAAPGSRQ